jgi:tRNA uridine 5-carboxymethylaminomethyl modification enzyme
MMTSRAEYRLTLRQDNADLRLTRKGFELGLVSEERHRKMLEKEKLLTDELARLSNVVVTPTEESNRMLEGMGSTPLKTAWTLYDLLKRPELNYDTILPFDKDRKQLPKEVRLLVETEIKYEGYIKKQMIQIDQFKKLENKRLPDDIDYSLVKGLSTEARQKLERIKPDSVGQASRISGVTPADINVLLIYLEQRRRSE